jgi:hypothetical protein
MRSCIVAAKRRKCEQNTIIHDKTVRLFVHMHGEVRVYMCAYRGSIVLVARMRLCRQENALAMTGF